MTSSLTSSWPSSNKAPNTEALEKFLRCQPGSNEALVYEISELRKEIAELRAELAPVPSLILTGRQALDEFKRLVER